MNEVVACLATIPSRKKELKLVCESLLPQVDRLFIYFNNYEESEVPMWAKSVNKVEYETSSSGKHGDLGDVGKFYFCSEEMKDTYGINGFVFTCDDDIIYPEWYTSRTIRLLKDEHIGKIVSYHGALIHKNAGEYHSSRGKSTFPCKGHVQRTRRVNVGGTGCMAFGLDTFTPSLKMFKHINMSDIFVAKHAQENGISLYVLRHSSGDFKVLNIRNTIWDASSRSLGGAMDRRSHTNEIVLGTDWDKL